MRTAAATVSRIVCTGAVDDSRTGAFDVVGTDAVDLVGTTCAAHSIHPEASYPVELSLDRKRKGTRKRTRRDKRPKR